MSTEIINVSSVAISGETVQTANARELHAFLEVKVRFNDWIKKRIEEYGFQEGVDFVRFELPPDTKLGESGGSIGGVAYTQKNVALESTGYKNFGQQGRIEYAITIDMGKELAMVERNEKGKQARRYFIECERQAKSGPRVSVLRRVTPEFKAALSMAKAFGFRGNQAVLSANNTVRKLYGTDCAKLIDATHLIAEAQEPLLTPTDIGARLDGRSAIAANKLLADHGFQLEERDLHGRKQWELTETGKKYAVYMDTGKKRGDGTPVRQIRWLSSVLNLIQPKAA